MNPTEKGFETHTGNYMWSMEPLSKQLWEMPWQSFALDWVSAHENGTYVHVEEPRHATVAIAEEADAVMRRHKEGDSAEQPLFMYLPFTAAHAPLHPLPEHAEKCAHMPHLWRRQFCGLLVGLDEAVGKLEASISEHLGDNTVLLFMSDNGGTPWFGGNNEPLRGMKMTPWEGGVRVPAFAVDLSGAGRLGAAGSEFPGIVHISDWFPTLSALAGPAPAPEPGLDGHNLLPALQANAPWTRESVLMEMHYGSEGEHVFPEDVAAYRKGRYKLIAGQNLRDPNWYTEPTGEQLAASHASTATWALEHVIRLGELWVGEGPFDTFRHLFVSVFLGNFFAATQPQPPVMLFDLETDPSERTNLADALPGVVAELQAEVAALKAVRPPQAKFWMTVDREKVWDSTLKAGECSTGRVSQEHCRFVHPWIADDADLSQIELVNGSDAWPFIKSCLLQLAKAAVLPLLVLLALRSLLATCRK